MYLFYQFSALNSHNNRSNVYHQVTIMGNMKPMGFECTISWLRSSLSKVYKCQVLVYQHLSKFCLIFKRKYPHENERLEVSSIIRKSKRNKELVGNVSKSKILKLFFIYWIVLIPYISLEKNEKSKFAKKP